MHITYLVAKYCRLRSKIDRVACYQKSCILFLFFLTLNCMLTDLWTEENAVSGSPMKSICIQHTGWILNDKMHSNHDELTMTCSEDWLQAAHTPMIVPSLVAHVTIGGRCWMVDDHVLLFFGLHAVFCFSTKCADRSSVAANTTIRSIFHPRIVHASGHRWCVNGSKWFLLTTM